MIMGTCSLMDLILFRFDLIFLMLDPQDEAYDRRLAKHLVSLYHQTREEEEEELVVSTREERGKDWRRRDRGWELVVSTRKGGKRWEKKG